MNGRIVAINGLNKKLSGDPRKNARAASLGNTWTGKRQSIAWREGER
jgi:hypothetical protein